MFENLVLHELYEKQAKAHIQLSREVAAAKQLLIEKIVSKTLDNWETKVIAELVDSIKTMAYHNATEFSFNVRLSTERLSVPIREEIPLDSMVTQIADALKNKIGIEKVTYTLPLSLAPDILVPGDECLRVNLNIHTKL